MQEDQGDIAQLLESDSDRERMVRLRTLLVDCIENQRPINPQELLELARWLDECAGHDSWRQTTAILMEFMALERVRSDSSGQPRLRMRHTA